MSSVPRGFGKRGLLKSELRVAIFSALALGLLIEMTRLVLGKEMLPSVMYSGSFKSHTHTRFVNWSY